MGWNKSYATLDRDRCLDILEGYGVGTRVCRILCTYWERMTMVAHVGGYYGEEFKGFQGLTQGELLPPTISNVVVDTLVRHWILLVAEGEEGPEGREVGGDATPRCVIQHERRPDSVQQP